MKKLTLGSLFDGSGGFPLGGMLAGITPVWASEIEPFAIRVTSKRIPSIKHYGDVSKMDGGKVEPVDIITFGSPCQDMSVAGKRAGLDGSRSNLFYEAVRIVKEMRCATNGEYPRFIVWENVPGAFSSNKGEDFRCVLEAICQIKDEGLSVPRCEKWQPAGRILGDGFDVAWRVLDAQYWGVPQRRKRIYLVADFAKGCAGKILFESEGLSRYSAESFRSWQRTSCRSADCSGEAGIGFDGYNGSVTEDKAATLGVNCGVSTGRNGVVLNDQGGNRMDVTDEVTCTLRAEAHHPPCVMEVFDNHSQDTRYTGPVEAVQPLSATMGLGGNNQPFVAEIPAPPPCSWDGGQISPTLTKQNAGGNQRMPDKENFNCVLQPFGISAKDSNAMKSSNPHSGVYEAETSRTIDTSGSNPGCNQGGIAIVAIEGNGSRPSHKGDGYKEGETMYTLNSVEQHAVAYEEPTYSMTVDSYMNVAEEKTPPILARDYKNATAVTEPSFGIGRDAFNQGKNAQYKPCIEEEVQPTIVAKGPGAVAHPFGFDPGDTRGFCKYFHEDCGNTVLNGSCPGHHNAVVDYGYTVRRLTPTECARLQGFPDWWCSNLGSEHPTNEEAYEWYKVFKTQAEIMGGKVKSDKQVRAWLKAPYSDASEYKLWGNGVALPCVFFVLAGIVYYTQHPAL